MHAAPSPHDASRYAGFREREVEHGLRRDSRPDEYKNARAVLRELHSTDSGRGTTTVASTGQFNICAAGTLSVELHRPGLLGMFGRSIDADCMQLSTRGMQIRTSADFTVGQSLVIDLQAHDLRVEELRGVVKSVSASDERYYYDIDFPLATQTRNTLHGLRQLASLTSVSDR